MKVILEQSGGFTGLKQTATLETSHLPAELASRLQQLIESGTLEQGADPLHPDAMHYAIIMTPPDGLARTYAFSEAGARPGLLELFDALWLEAQLGRRGI